MAAGDRDLGSVLTAVIARWPILAAGVICFGAVGTLSAVSDDPLVTVQRSITVDTGNSSSTNVADRAVENVVQTLNDPGFRSSVGPAAEGASITAAAVRSTDYVVLRAESVSAEQADAALADLMSTYEDERVASVQQAQQALTDEYSGRVAAIDQQIDELSSGESQELTVAQVSALATERTRLQSELATRLASVQVALPDVTVGGQSNSVESVPQKVVKSGVVWAALGLVVGGATALALVFLARRFRRYPDLGVWLPSDVLHSDVSASDRTMVSTEIIKRFQLLGLGSGPRRLGLVASVDGGHLDQAAGEARAWFQDQTLLGGSGDSARSARSVEVKTWRLATPLPFSDARVGVMLVHKGVERGVVLDALALARSLGCDRWAVLWVSPFESERTSDENEASEAHHPDPSGTQLPAEAAWTSRA